MFLQISKTLIKQCANANHIFILSLLEGKKQPSLELSYKPSPSLLAPQPNPSTETQKRPIASLSELYHMQLLHMSIFSMIDS